MPVRFNPPPNWPAPPPGWTPPSGWQPDPTWPAAPDGWQFWVEDPPSPQWSTPVAADERTQPAASQEPEQPAPSQEPAGRGVPLFGARKRAQELENENAWLRQQLAALGALDNLELARQREGINGEVEAKRQELDQLTADIVATSDLAVLQEVGVYQYHHPLENAEQHKAALARLSEQIKSMARSGQAIEATTSWTVNNSAAEGRAMVRDLSKLMLRAYNAEAENCARRCGPATFLWR